MTDPFLAATAPDSPHYLRALTDMADRRAVVTQDAIYTDNGIKLVEKGARIDSRLYDRLVQHKLREPIDRHLTVENAVDVPALIAAGQDLAEQGVLPQMLAQALGSAGKLLAPLRSVSLPDPVAFKLTLMRDQRPGLFEHSLQMMMVAVFLGLKSGLSERDCVPLAAAALLHDAGVLHMDPILDGPPQQGHGCAAQAFGGPSHHLDADASRMPAFIPDRWRLPCSSTTSAWMAAVIRAACLGRKFRPWGASCCWPRW